MIPHCSETVVIEQRDGTVEEGAWNEEAWRCLGGHNTGSRSAAPLDGLLPPGNTLSLVSVSQLTKHSCVRIFIPAALQPLQFRVETLRSKHADSL